MTSKSISNWKTYHLVKKFFLKGKQLLSIEKYNMQLQKSYSV